MSEAQVWWHRRRGEMCGMYLDVQCPACLRVSVVFSNTRPPGEYSHAAGPSSAAGGDGQLCTMGRVLMAQTTVVRALSDALANRWGLLLHEEAVRPACERPAVLVHLGGADSIRIVERYTSMNWRGPSR